jgi:hypothetical protein
MVLLDPLVCVTLSAVSLGFLLVGRRESLEFTRRRSRGGKCLFVFVLGRLVLLGRPLVRGECLFVFAQGLFEPTQFRHRPAKFLPPLLDVVTPHGVLGAPTLVLRMHFRVRGSRH